MSILRLCWVRNLPHSWGTLWASSQMTEVQILRAEPSFWRQGLQHPVGLGRKHTRGICPHLWLGGREDRSVFISMTLHSRRPQERPSFLLKSFI